MQSLIGRHCNSPKRSDLIRARTLDLQIRRRTLYHVAIKASSIARQYKCPLIHIPRLHTYRSFLMPLQQTSFENIVTKEEVAQNNQFLLLPQCFQHSCIFILSYIRGNFNLIETRPTLHNVLNYFQLLYLHIEIFILFY